MNVSTQSCKRVAIVVRWSLSGGLTVYLYLPPNVVIPDISINEAQA